jgi:uncharacterized tellurite resistance protein B-like protein
MTEMSTLKKQFLNLYQMALADSKLEVSELELLYKIGEEKGIPVTEIDDIIIHPDLVEDFKPETVIEKVECLYDLARIAVADGNVDENERKLLNSFAHKFDFKEENIPLIVQFLVDEAISGTPISDINKVVMENL